MYGLRTSSPSHPLVRLVLWQGNGLCTIYAGRMAAEFMGFEDQIRLGVFYLAWLLEHEDVQLRGVTYVETFEGFSFRQALGLRNVLSGAQQKARLSRYSSISVCTKGPWACTCTHTGE
jgi:hypothetical protein